MQNSTYFTQSPGYILQLREEFSLCRVYKKSNFVRAFDRRPIGVENTVQMRAQAAPDDGATAFHQSPSAGEITCSHDSSTSGHHGQPFQTGEISDMAIDNEPIWEWEQLDQYWSKQGHSDQP